MEFRFQPGKLTGDVFDIATNDVRAVVAGPGGVRRLIPAFPVDSQTFAVRIKADRPGIWRVAEVRVNGKRPGIRLPKPQTAAAPDTKLTMARRHPRLPTRFADDKGNLLWPIGHNTAWSTNTPDALVAQLRTMALNGLDWSRIWMCHWDGKNLDWPADPAGRPISGTAATKWDVVVNAAEELGIRFQMVLQHHGQYSTKTNPNWDDNPWNVRNGGFLKSPVEFFTHPEAKRRTRNKYRYIIARWGCSPAVFAWELFNEVEWTDAIVEKKSDIVAAWHREMASFLRQHDPWRHMVTTSSDRGIPGLYDVMDFVQPHAYPPDGVGAVNSLRPLDKPAFHGEIGPGTFPLDKEDGRFLVPVLWAGIATQESAAPQYWTWDTIDRNRLYPFLQSASGFVRASGMASWEGLRSTPLRVESDSTGKVDSGPGLGWGESKRTRFPILADGTIDGIGEMPGYLQGNGHREMFPEAEFPITVERPCVFRIQVKQASKAGAELAVSVDGAVVQRRSWSVSGTDRSLDETVDVALEPGRHVVRLRNTGPDWLVIGRIQVDPFGSALRALGRTNGTQGLVWVTRTVSGERPVNGTLVVPDVRPGRYRVCFWDIDKGVPGPVVDWLVRSGVPARVPLPPVATQMALWFRPV
ncbi:MAG: hypothetical protein ACOVT5_07855 [Armatimonadaceae bacterium]